QLALLERAAGAVPGREQDPVLRPREHPRDRPQVLEPATRAARRRARPDRQLAELVERRDLVEEAHERLVVDERAVDVARTVGGAVDLGAERVRHGRLRRGAAEQERGQLLLERAAGEAAV